MKTAKKIFRILGTVFLVFLIAVVILMFNARMSGEAPSVFGYQIFRVSTPSMEPQLMVGDVILVKDTELEDIKKGDIITYKGEVGDFAGKFITHKVVEEPVCDNGEYMFTTKGIAKESINNDPTVYGDQVLGVYLFTVPFVDKIYTFFLQPYGLMTFILVIVVLFAYELISLIVSYKTLDEIDDVLDEDSVEENASDDVDEATSDEKEE